MPGTSDACEGGIQTSRMCDTIRTRVEQIRYFATARGESPVGDYLSRLVQDGRSAEVANILHVIDLLSQMGGLLGAPYSRMLDRQARIYELRAGAHRIAYARQDDAYLLLHAWRKQTRKADERELNRARRRLGAAGSTD